MLALLMALAGAALAQDPAHEDDPRAQELYDNGAALYDEGQYEDAVSAWQAAYAISKRPLLLYDIANAEERLGQYQSAIDHLNHYRAYATTEEREPLDRRIYNLERRIDHRDETPPDPEPQAALTAQAIGPAVSPQLPTPRRSGSRAPVGAITLLSIGGAGLVTGGTFGGLALAARGDARSRCAPTGLCPNTASDAITHDRMFSVVADLGYAVGIVGALSGGIGLAARPRPIEVSLQYDAIRVAGAF